MQLGLVEVRQAALHEERLFLDILVAKMAVPELVSEGSFKLLGLLVRSLLEVDGLVVNWLMVSWLLITLLIMWLVMILGAILVVLPLCSPEVMCSARDLRFLVVKVMSIFLEAQLFCLGYVLIFGMLPRNHLFMVVLLMSFLMRLRVHNIHVYVEDCLVISMVILFKYGSALNDVCRVGREGLVHLRVVLRRLVFVLRRLPELSDSGRVLLYSVFDVVPGSCD